MNDIERAIKSIQSQKKDIGIDYTKGKDMTAICLLGDQAETVIRALEKQIPKQPEVTPENEHICPICHCSNGSGFNHCWNCGQNISGKEKAV